MEADFHSLDPGEKNHRFFKHNHEGDAQDTLYLTRGTSDFDAQMSGIKFWKVDENLRPVFKNRLRNIKWLLAFWTFYFIESTH